VARQHPSSFQESTIWAARTFLAIAVIGALSIGLIWLLGFVLGFLQPVLVPLAVAGIIAYLLDPVIRLLTRKGLREKTATMLVFVSFLVLVIVLATVVIVPTFGQADDLYESRAEIKQKVTKGIQISFGSIQERLGSPVAKQWYDKGIARLTEAGPEITQNIGNWLWSRVRGVFGFLGYLLGMILVPVYLYYFLKESHHIAATWSDYLPLKASRFKQEVVKTIDEINGYLIAFFRGQMVVSLIDGMLVGISLLILRLDYALLIGVFVALLGLLPYIGNALCLIPAMLIALAQFSDPEAQWIAFLDEGWMWSVLVLVIFTGVQQLNSLVTAPRIVGDSVGLHPFTVIFSVLFWSLVLGGLLGALLAVPLTASVKVILRRYVWENRLKEQTVAGAAGET
jgi:predicted PurR-regulated permease PerM